VRPNTDVNAGEKAVTCRPRKAHHLRMTVRTGWVDRSNPPVWVWTFPAQYDFDEFSREVEDAFASLATLSASDRLGVIIDLSLVQSSEPRRRQLAGQFLQQHRERVVAHTVAWGFVIPNPIIRGAVTAIGWVGSFPVPMKMFSEFYECRHWVDQQLALDDLRTDPHGRAAGK